LERLLILALVHTDMVHVFLFQKELLPRGHQLRMLTGIVRHRILLIQLVELMNVGFAKAMIILLIQFRYLV